MKRALLVLLALCGSARAGGILTTGPGITLRCANGLTLVSNGTTWTCSAAAGVTGAGTTNTIPIWTGTNTLGNSPLVYNGTTTISTSKEIGSTTRLWAGAIAPGDATPINADGRESATSGIVLRLSSAVSGSRAFIQMSDGFTYNYGIGTEGATGDLLFSSGVFAGAAGTERMRIAQGGAVTMSNTATIAASETGGSGRVDAVTINGTQTGTATLGDGPQIHLASNSSNYNGFIALVNTATSPSFLDPKISFYIQNAGTTGTGNVTDRLDITNAGAKVTGTGEITGAATLDSTLSVTGIATFSNTTGTAINISNSSSDTGLQMANGSAGGRTFIIGSGGNASGAPNVLSIYDVTGTTFRAKFGATSTTVNNLSTDTLTLHGAGTIDSTFGVNPAASATAGVTVTWSPTGSSSGAFYANMTPSANTSSVYTINAATAGTFNTTSGALFSYGLLAQLSSTRSSGANNLTNIGIYSTATGAQSNIAIQTDNGDVKLATVSGATTIGTTTTTTQISASQVNFHGSAADSYFYFGGTDTYIRGNGGSTHVYIGDNGTSGTVEIAAQGATTNNYGKFAQSYTSTAVAADAKSISSTNTGTFNTTAAGRNSYGEFISVANSISSGANTLTSVGSYIDNTSSGANITAYSLYTDHGDVRLNATNGITGIKGPLSVDNTNSSATATSAQFNYTATAQTGSGAAALGTNSGTFNTTAGTITSYGVKGSATSTRSSGANNLVNVGLYGTASGAQLNYASYLDGDERIKGHELFNVSSAPTGSGCSLDSNSTDAQGLVTMSTASTTLCTVTFNVVYPVTPFCVCSKGVNDGTAEVMTDCEGASTSTMTIHATAATVAGKFTYRCSSHE